ncbi:putative deoxyribodipyrimidine photolyase [Namao virus]|nr:putative deoxyribodipyrimidine photolyase [Namao virus]
MVNVDSLGVYIFFKDLRLHDNDILNTLSKKCHKIICLCLLDEPNQHKCIDNTNFLYEAILDLNLQLRRHGSRLYVVLRKNILSVLNTIKNNFTHKICVGFFGLDLTLPPDYDVITYETRGLTKVHKNYLKFSAYYQQAKNVVISPIDAPLPVKYFKKSIDKIFDLEILVRLKVKYSLKTSVLGQRSFGLRRIKETLNDPYYLTNYVLMDQVHLSQYSLFPYLDLGIISLREAYVIYNQSNMDTDLKTRMIKELYKRDFYAQYQSAKSLSKILQIKWPKVNLNYWTLFLEGNTGFLIIDAGITELQMTGMLHEKMLEMIIFFWTKCLLIDIYDPQYGIIDGLSRLLSCANFDLIKWYVLQTKYIDLENARISRYDPDGIYIKKWLPHLKVVDVKYIRSWSTITKNKLSQDFGIFIDHNVPLFNQKEQYKQWIKINNFKAKK